jgi:hypothetical protein
MVVSENNQKGQSFIEYALLLALVVGVILIFYFLLGSWFCQQAAKFGVPLCSNPSESSQSGSTPVTRAMSLLITLMPIGLPVTLAIIASLFEGTTSIKNNYIYLEPGRLSGNICFSGITFDTWALVTILQNEGFLASTRLNIGICMVFLFLLHLGFYCLCLKIIPGHKWQFLQILFIILSIASPVCFLLPTNIFIVPG